MIIVKTLDEFQKFIDLAKQHNLPYSIIGTEKEDFEGVVTSLGKPKNNKFYGKYALLCSLFNVIVSVKSDIDEKHTITDISSTFRFTKFKQIYLKDGILHCNN